MSVEKQIEEIMDYFDFAKVAKTMAALDWEWWDSDYHTPIEPELRRGARKLLNLCYKESKGLSGRYTTGCGGFVAECEEGRLSLRFEVASWAWYPDGNPAYMDSVSEDFK